MLTRFKCKPFSTIQFEKLLLIDKFKGCLVGSLIGDCYGKPFKLSDTVSKIQLHKYFEKLDGPYFKAPFKAYSSCTALSNCIAKSIIQTKGYHATDVAKSFVKEFFDNPHRDYGTNLSQICMQLRGSKFADPMEPARQQYFGTGSYGNRAATYIAPVSLFYFTDAQKMVEVAESASQLTNANILGKNGALFQCWAIRLALDLSQDLPVNVSKFMNLLAEKVNEFETDEEGLQLKDALKYKEQLNLVNKLLDQHEPSDEEVVSTLGHAKIAHYSVPTAVYCFLRAVKDINEVKTNNPFRRSVQYAIGLGGHADAIASMTGAIAGACYGYNAISQPLQTHCEGITIVTSLAEELSNCVLNTSK